MSVCKQTFQRACILSMVVLMCMVRPLYAAPNFYIEGNSAVVTNINETWKVKLFTDGSTITAAQTVINFNPTYFHPVQVSTVNSLCSFWAPADPTLGFGNGSTPTFIGGNKIVISCGFSNPGYNSSGLGDQILSYSLKPIASGSAQFVFSNSQFRYIGTTIAPGVSPVFDVDAFGSSVYVPPPTPTPTPRPSVNPSASPTPTPSPSPTPTPTSTESGTISSPTPTPDTLKASDLVLVEVGKNRSGQTNQQSGTNEEGLIVADPDLEVVEEDNAIPPPPADMELRARATPFVYQNATDSGEIGEGDVLSLQSLRELLIPGKSQADKTLVLFNLISTLTFITLLAVLIWRMIVSTRTTHLKYRHMNDILEGELAVIETKLEGLRLGSGSDVNVEGSLEELKKELEKSR